MKALTKALDKVLAGICVVLFSLLVVVVVWQVFSRQVLNSPQAWTEELSRYVFVWLGLFAAALVFSERAHVAVDFVARRFGPGGQRAIAIFIQVLIGVFAVVILIWGGWRVAGGAWGQELSALPVTLGQMYTVMPITGVLILFYSVANVIALFTGELQGFPDSEEEQLVADLASSGDIPAEPNPAVDPGKER